MNLFRINTFASTLVAGIILTVPCSSVLALDTLAVIDRVIVDEKQNGIYVYAVTSRPINRENLSGWITENNWAYITIYKARTDSGLVSKEFRTGPVSRIEASNTRESTQLAIQLRKPVSTIEYFTGDNPPSISFTLGYPEGPVTVASKVKPRKEVRVSDTTRSSFLPWYEPLKKSFYLAGTVMAVAGILSSDKSDSGSGDLVAGLSILGGTYVFDTYIMPRIRQNKEPN